MSDEALAGPSLLLAGHHIAQREHHGHQHPLHHQHQHQNLHRRQTEAGEAAVTQVVATISVVQQIDIDANGNTLASTLLSATTDSSPLLTDSTPSSTPSISSVDSPISTVPSTIATGSSSDSSGQSSVSSSSLSALSAPTSTPSIRTGFASLIASSNSTTLISSLSSSPRIFSNSTRSTSRSSLTYLTSSSASTSSYSTTGSISSYYSLDPGSTPTSTDGVFIAGGGTRVASGATSSTAVSGSGSGSKSEPATSTPVIVGSVVSSVAGAAVIILALVFVWRWKKKSRNMISLGSGGPGDGVDKIHGGDPSQSSGTMVERRSFINAVPAALASLTGYKRSSKMTDRTISSTAGSEKGFYRVSGRKLPSVLQTGGDGYSNGFGDISTNTLSGSSFYRDSEGFYGGPGTPSFPPVGVSNRESGQVGTPIMRPSPARTPVTEHGPFAPFPPTISPPARRPDALGRSHPSQDGSHGSKFTENV